MLSEMTYLISADDISQKQILVLKEINIKTLKARKNVTRRIE